jgi:exodeoxyribonuclease-3
VKVATYINDINERRENLLTWLARTTPDVVGLQELKAEQAAFPAEASKTGCSTLPGAFRRSPSALHRGRGEWSYHFEMEILSPARSSITRLAWFERLLTHAAELIAAGVPLVLAGTQACQVSS